MATNSFRVFFLAILLIASPLLQVVLCQLDSEVEATEGVDEVSDLGIVGEDAIDFGDGSFSSAPGIDTTCIFPNNKAHLVTAGEESELLVGMKNDGESTVNVIAIKASVHFSYDHRMLIQNLTAQGFNNATVPGSSQATFPYIFAVSKYLQPGTFDLVGTVIYEIDQQPYQNTFFNGTIEVAEAGGFLSIESVFLVTLGIALLVLLGLWIQGQLQNLSKTGLCGGMAGLLLFHNIFVYGVPFLLVVLKTKRASKVEVGTNTTTDASMDEWLQGTAYTQSLSSKSKKKK